MRGKSEHPVRNEIPADIPEYNILTCLPFLRPYLRLTFGCEGKEITEGAFSTVRAAAR